MYLIDTNIIIYYFNDNIPESANSKVTEIFKNHFNISVISKMEFLGFRKHTESSFSAAQNFLDHADIINLDDNIINLVIEIRRKNKVRLPDSIIAATALNKEQVLVTRNVKDFEGIPKLEVYNPFS